MEEGSLRNVRPLAPGPWTFRPEMEEWNPAAHADRLSGGEAVVVEAGWLNRERKDRRALAAKQDPRRSPRQPAHQGEVLSFGCAHSLKDSPSYPSVIPRDRKAEFADSGGKKLQREFVVPRARLQVLAPCVFYPTGTTIMHSLAPFMPQQESL